MSDRKEMWQPQRDLVERLASKMRHEVRDSSHHADARESHALRREPKSGKSYADLHMDTELGSARKQRVEAR